MQTLIRKQVKNIWNFFGGQNVSYDKYNESAIVSRVNRKNPLYYLINIIMLIAILIFVLLFVSFLFGKDCISSIFVGFVFICINTFLIISVRLREGDTIVTTDGGIMELNWLFVKYIKWSDIIEVTFYSGGKPLKQLLGLKVFAWQWTNIKIKSSTDTIRINTAYSNNEQLQQCIKRQCFGKVNEGKFDPLYLLIGLLAAIAGIFGAIYLSKLRGLIK